MRKCFKSVGIVTTKNPSKKILLIIKNFLYFLPDSIFFKRKKLNLMQILCYFKLNFFENFLFIKEEKKKGSVLLWHVNLKLKVSIFYQIFDFLPMENTNNIFYSSNNKPEIILKNFRGNRGKAVAFMLRSLFPIHPNFKSRQVVSLVFYESYILFRFFRYIFSASGKDVKLQDIGPRFTLYFYKIFQNIPKKFFFL
jgi:rRNA maturation protein Rpf1